MTGSSLSSPLSQKIYCYRWKSVFVRAAVVCAKLRKPSVWQYDMGKLLQGIWSFLQFATSVLLFWLPSVCQCFVVFFAIIWSSQHFTLSYDWSVVEYSLGSDCSLEMYFRINCYDQKVMGNMQCHAQILDNLWSGGGVGMDQWDLSVLSL